MFLWVVTAIASLLGGYFAWWSFGHSETVMQQVGGGVYGLVIALVPYIFTRAVDELGRKR